MSSLLNIEAFFDLAENQYNYKKDLIIIAGPTCVGKSMLAMKLAKKINGVLVNADSVQVYEDLKLLSARPTEKDMQKVPHFLYGYVKSQTNYSIVDWLQQLRKVLDNLEKIKKTAILVGGSGLYLKAVVNGLAPIPKLREETKIKSLLKLREIGYNSFKEINMNIDPQFVSKNHDKHRLLRSYGVFLQTKKNMTYWYKKPKEEAVKKNIYSFLISLDRKLIYQRCELRFDNMLEKGALEEVKKLHASNIDRSLPIAKSLGVKWLLSYLDKNISFEEAVRLSKRDTRRYVKRQITWFNHNYIPYKTIIMK
jgi:tRNA dimethylallyltransferase